MNTDRPLTWWSRWHVLVVALVVLLSLGHCVAPELDANCAQCPCPEGYECTAEQVCIKLQDRDRYPALCAAYLPQQELQTEAKAELGGEPPDDGAEGKPEVSAEASPEVTVEPTPEPPPEVPMDTAPQGLLNLHDACDLSPFARADGRCGQGLRCVRSSFAKAVCLQDCSGNPDLCKAPRSECRQINWELVKGLARPVSVCVQEQSKAGDNCDPSRSSFCRRASQEGAEHLVCRQGKCVVGKLEFVQNVSCDPANAQKPIECDLTQKLTCNTAGKCVQGLPSEEGEQCDENLSNRLCGPGHLCTSVNDSPAICRRTCQQSADCGNVEAFYCLPVTPPLGVCLQLGCSHHSQCTVRDPPHNCVIQSFPIIGDKGECRPFSTTGPKEVGEACDDGKNACQYPLNCIKLVGSSGSFCTLPCFTALDCTVGALAGQCITTSSHKVNLCIWQCKDKPFCPGSLSCLSVQSGGNTLKICGRP